MLRLSRADVKLVLPALPAVAGFWYVCARVLSVLNVPGQQILDLSLSQITRLLVGACVGFLCAMALLWAAASSFYNEEGRHAAATGCLASALGAVAYVMGFAAAFNLRLFVTGSRVEALISAMYSWLWVVWALYQWIGQHWNEPIGVTLHSFWRLILGRI